MTYLSKSTLARTLAISTIILAALFFLNRRCFPYWTSLQAGLWKFPIVTGFIVLGLIPLWAFVFLCMKWKGRGVLAGCTVLAVVVFVSTPDKRLIPTPAAESSAVNTLLQMQSALQAGRAKYEQSGFALALPRVTTRFPVERFYIFDYRPSRSTDGSIETFEISATLTPGARSCGCSRNFMIMSDGSMHYTSDPRPATASDRLFEIGPGLRSSAAQ
jgi:hypothetical protein